MDSVERVRLLVLSVLSVGAALSFYAVLASEPDKHMLVAFLNVGQGDAIYIKSPAGNDMLIDAGREDGRVLSALSEVMPVSDRRINVIVATHFDADHIGGFPEVLKRFSVDAVVVSGNDSDTGIARAFQDAIAEEDGIKQVQARAGTIIDLGGGVTFEVLFPDRNPFGFETNLSSIVGILKFGLKTMLFSGDAPDEIERYLVTKEGKRLDVDVLKLGHHGSHTSTSVELLDTTTPVYAVVSAGNGNTYGHPTKSVTDLLLQKSICLVRTDESGTIVFYSDGFQFKTQTVCSSTTGPTIKNNM